MVCGVLNLLGYTRQGGSEDGELTVADTIGKTYSLVSYVDEDTTDVIIAFSEKAVGLFLAIATLREGAEQFTFRTSDVDVDWFGAGRQMAKGSLILNLSKEWNEDPFSSTQPPTHKTTMDEIFAHYYDGEGWNKTFEELYERYYVDMGDSSSESSTI